MAKLQSATRSIVMGVDFTPGCASAVRAGLRMAEWNRAYVRAVHVIDTLVAIDIEHALSSMQQNIRSGLIDDARAAWKAFAAEIPGAGGIPLDVLIDNRIRGILSVAKAAEADLLVLGVHVGKHPSGVGSVAKSCVRHARCEVLLVRNDMDRGGAPAAPFRSIVACVDFSRTSLRALDHAARIAAQDGAALHVLHVFDPPWKQVHYRAPTPEADVSFVRQYSDGLLHRLQAFAGELEGGSAELSFLKPRFAIHEYEGHRSGIVDFASRVNADLIVLGTRGRTNLRDITLGSTAEKALAETRCSVLAVKPDAAEMARYDRIEDAEPHAQMREPG